MSRVQLVSCLIQLFSRAWPSHLLDNEWFFNQKGAIAALDIWERPKLHPSKLRASLKLQTDLYQLEDLHSFAVCCDDPGSPDSAVSKPRQIIQVFINNLNDTSRCIIWQDFLNEWTHNFCRWWKQSWLFMCPRIFIRFGQIYKYLQKKSRVWSF